MGKKVIITDYLHPYLAQQLTEMEYDVTVNERISDNELEQIIHQFHGVVLSTRTIITRNIINKAAQLKFIARAGSGLDNIDVEYAKSKGILVVSSPEGNANAVAEHALAMLLCLFNNIYRANQQVKNGLWRREENRGIELQGKTVGIIGLGNTGCAFAQKLRSLGVNILAYDKYISGFGDNTIIECSLEHIQSEAEIISFHVPLTDETHHYLDESFIKTCRKEFWLINTSRGKVVNTSDLIFGLKSRKIKGAALDVLENENFQNFSLEEQNQFGQLKQFDNILFSPHIAGWTQESLYKIAVTLSRKIKTVIAFDS